VKRDRLRTGRSVATRTSAAAKFLDAEATALRRMRRELVLKAQIEEAAKNPSPAVDEATIQKALVPTAEDIDVLNGIAAGRAPRNSQAILSAIKLKLEYSTRKPEPAATQAQAPVTVVINTIGEAAPTAAAATTPAEEDTIQ
jgi:hypothetical protein